MCRVCGVDGLCGCGCVDLEVCVDLGVCGWVVWIWRFVDGFCGCGCVDVVTRHFALFFQPRFLIFHLVVLNIKCYQIMYLN